MCLRLFVLVHTQRTTATSNSDFVNVQPTPVLTCLKANLTLSEIVSSPAVSSLFFPPLKFKSSTVLVYLRIKK